MATNHSTKSAKGIAALATSTTVPDKTTMEKLRLPCRLDSFFPFCRLAWGYYGQNVAAFTADSPRFTQEFGEQQLALIGPVEQLPTSAARKAAATQARIQLLTDAQAVKMLAQKLKNFIEFLFPDRVVSEAALKQAGLYEYSELGTKWAKIAQMVNSANGYLSAHLAELVADDNMPPTFPAAFAAAGTAFNASWTDFLVKEKAAIDGTGTQEEGIRQILAGLNPMLKAGKRIFIFDPLTRKKFTAADLKNEVQGMKPAGVAGTVRMAGTGQALANVTVTAALGDDVRTALTDAEGKYKLKLVSSTYDVVFTSAGTEPYTFRKVVKPGVVGRLNVELMPPVMAPAAQPTIKPIVEQPSTAALLQQAMEGVATNGMVEVEG